MVLPLVALAIAGAAAWGLGLRLVDPLSSSTIPAEDPYTHLALTREHLRDGSLQGLDGQGQPYPPGLHAVLAVYTVHSGVDMASLVRFLPVAFGVIAVVGTALMLRRLDGNAAAVVGALAVAVTPELVFRSQMFAPTALDLALLPFALLALVQTARGRLGWALPAAVLLAFVVVSHPWAFGILGLAGAAFVALAFAFPWRDGPRLDPVGLAVGALLLGTSTALALSGCWGTCGPGFAVVEGQDTQRFDSMALAVLGATILIAMPLLLARRPARNGLKRLTPLGPVGRSIASTALVGAFVYVLWLAKAGGYPALVSPQDMMGWPLFVLAGVGLAAVPWARGPAAHAAAGVIAATLPFTVFDPFDSPFWSHRTAVYLALGLCMAAGVAAGATARAIVATAAWSARGKPAGWSRAIVPGLVAAILLGTSVVSAAPQQYPEGWYRLYDECESEALADISALAQADPSLTVATGAWQSKLVLAATTDDAERIWYIPNLGKDPAETQRLLKYSQDTDRPVLIVLDQHAKPSGNATPAQPDWQPAGSWSCTAPLTAHLHDPT